MTSAVHTTSDDDGMDEIEAAMTATEGGLIFTNLVDFDTVYGHRNETAGYAANLERFDAPPRAAAAALRDDDLLVVTADHGNDPTTPSTDHSREHVPVLLYGGRSSPAPTSAFAGRSPISARRSPNCSAWGRSSTEPASRGDPFNSGSLTSVLVVNPYEGLGAPAGAPRTERGRPPRGRRKGVRGRARMKD